MKIYFAARQDFFPEVIDEYMTWCTEVFRLEDAELIVTQFDEISEVGKDCEAILTNTTATDHIRVRHVPIISLDGENLIDFTAVPELCLGMMIYLSRIFKREEIKGQILGIIGYGRIGQQLHSMADFMGMHVMWADKDTHTIDSLLENADVVSLHITASEENRHCFGLSTFLKMKDGAIFLNSARPWLVDEEALKFALNYKLAGAWYDFDIETEHPRLITTPHLGGSTYSSRAKSQLLIAKKAKKLYGPKQRP